MEFCNPFSGCGMWVAKTQNIYKIKRELPQFEKQKKGFFKEIFIKTKTRYLQ